MRETIKKRLNFLIFPITGIFLIISFFMISSFTIKNQNEEKNWSVPEIPANPEFCGEKVPLDKFDVKERFEKELIINKYYHSTTIQSLRRTTKWFPLISEILKKNNVPEDFKYLALIESNLENLVSYRGATGFWQIMPDAGKELGLEINNEIDERYDVIKSTEAACRYLKNAYTRFGNWTTAAASYNIGLSGISRLMDKQKTQNYYDVYMGEETSRYIFRILAMKELVNNPEKFGYFLRETDYFAQFEYKEITINDKIESWVDFAIENKISYRQFKAFNPWVRDYQLQNKENKIYKIRLPKED